MTDPTEESPLKFPCDFPVKAMGHASDGFDTHVLEIVRKHYPQLDDTRVTLRNSQGGKYISVTVTIVAQSRDQLDAIYQELTDSERVLMAL